MSQAYGPADRDESVATIHRALDIGVSFLDTANVYGDGHNEHVVGKAIAGRRDEVVLATKFGIVAGRRRQSIDQRSSRVRAPVLRRVAGPARRRPHRPLLPAPRRSDRADRGHRRRDGRAGRRGQGPATSGSPRPARTASNGPMAIHPIAALQSEWSLWTRDLEDDVLGTARRLGIGSCRSARSGGASSPGPSPSPDDFGADDFRRSNPRFQGENFDANLAVVAEVRRLAEAKGMHGGPAGPGLAARPGRRRRPDPGHQATFVPRRERGGRRRRADLRRSGRARGGGAQGIVRRGALRRIEPELRVLWQQPGAGVSACHSSGSSSMTMSNARRSP